MDKIVKILKKIKIRNIIVLIILLSFNTYAWFIYSTRASINLSAHVSAWDVEFTTKEDGVTSNIIIDLAQIYPGMEDFERRIEVVNRGEVNVNLSYSIKSLKVLDEYYEVTPDSGITSDDIFNKLATDYPFKVTIEKDDSSLAAIDGTGYFRIAIQWPYESGNDELDTLWGTKAYNYYEANPGEKSLELQLILEAIQTTPTTNP